MRWTRRATLVTAHRLATTQRAARMAVINQCQIIADISYAALIREGREYADLARMQLAP